MDEGETVEDLKGCSRTQYIFGETVLEKGISKDAQTRTNPFSAYFNHISQRVIQACRGCRKCQFAEKFLNGEVDLLF